MEEGKDAADRKDKSRPQNEQQELIHHVKQEDVSEVLDCAEDVVHAQWEQVTRLQDRLEEPGVADLEK